MDYTTFGSLSLGGEMNNQGRLINAIVILTVSMTVGTLLLLVLEGKPLTPVAFSLSSSSEINTSVSRETVGTKNGILPDAWEKIEISYINSAREIANSRTTGNLDLANHFVICNGSNGTIDGQILATTTWYNQKNVNDPLNSNVIKICMITDSSYKPTPWQFNKLESLVKCLARHCSIPLDQIQTVK